MKKQELLSYLQAIQENTYISNDLVSEIQAVASGLTDDNWVDVIHDYVDSKLEHYSPSLENDLIRRVFLRMRDYPLHIDNYNPETSQHDIDMYNKGTYKYITSSRDRVLKDLESDARPEFGSLFIWKVYNMGFVVRSSEATFAIDITSRPTLSPVSNKNPNEHVYPEQPIPTWTQADFERLAKQIDVYLITHPHGDHYDVHLINEVLKAGNHVVLPCADLSQYDTETKFDDLLDYSDFPGQVLVLDKTHTVPVVRGGVSIMNAVGHQGDRPCNIYGISMDSIGMLHNGDNYCEKAMSLIKEYRGADIVMASSVHVAQEQSKTGWDEESLVQFVEAGGFDSLPNLRVRGVMGIATYTDCEAVQRHDFEALAACMRRLAPSFDESFDTLSMGMSGDYELAIECGATSIRVGSLIFGER